ncbi:MAG: hypothetical protein WC829_01355 [Hyphomicrobium sp.]|jgi:hypothetical protein
MNDSPFPPFALPQNPSPPLAPEQPKAKKPRRVGKAKELAAPYAEALPAAPEKPARKKRGPNKAKAPNQRTPKFDLQTILGAASTLKEADMPAFEKMIELLQDAGKPGRTRLLEALGKVFG